MADRPHTFMLEIAKRAAGLRTEADQLAQRLEAPAYRSPTHVAEEILAGVCPECAKVTRDCLCNEPSERPLPPAFYVEGE